MSFIMNSFEISVWMGESSIKKFPEVNRISIPLSCFLFSYDAQVVRYYKFWLTLSQEDKMLRDYKAEDPIL